MPHTPAKKRSRTLTRCAAFALLAAVAVSSAHADMLYDVGVYTLRQVEPTLTGAGVAVAQVEYSPYNGPVDAPYNPQYDVDHFEFDPSQVFTGPWPSITYIGKDGTTPTSTFDPNRLSEVNHANDVANAFFGTASGVAPGVSTIYNYNVNFYANDVILTNSPSSLGITVPPKVVNQSFAFSPDPSDDAIIAQAYDNYVDQTGTIFVSAAGNGPAYDMTLVQSPADAYNVIAVGALGINPGSTGTLDNRSKPDITAPGSLSSFTTPLVSGVATLLVQAGTPMGAAAVDPRTVKALLLNGAVKTLGWSHTQTAPLDSQAGAGIVNAMNSYRNLVAGQQSSTATTLTGNLGGPYLPISTAGNTVLPNQGWALNTIQSSASSDAVDHYLVNLGTDLGGTTSVTLTWNRPYTDVLSDYPNTPAGGINNLDLYLYNATTGMQISASTSTVDNVEQLYLPALTYGTYDIEVVKNGGGSGNSNWVSDSDTYALAWINNRTGDANLDGKVDISDLNTVTSHWQATGQIWTTGDFNGDGKVDIFDLNAVTSNWQAGSTPAPIAYLMPAATGSTSDTSGSGGISPSGGAVPEPASISLLACGSALLLARRRRV